MDPSMQQAGAKPVKAEVKEEKKDGEVKEEKEEEEVVAKKPEYEIHTFPEEGGFCVVTLQVI
jgi:hypothetical protein